MRAGNLDRRIRLERATTEENDFGAEVKAWALLAEVWARVEYGAGNEVRTDMEVKAEQRRTFSIRWRELLVTDRIVYESRVWEILDIAELGRRDGLEITAIARTDKETA